MSGDVVAATVAPTTLLAGKHRGGVVGVAWLSATSLASVGADHAIRIVDLEGEAAESGGGDSGVGREVVAMSSPKAITAIAASPMGSLLATAHPDHCVRLWDSRGRSSAAAALGEGGDARVSTSLADGLRAVASYGTSWASSVAWSPESSHHLALASYDGSVTVWDARSPTAPLFVDLGSAAVLQHGAAAASGAGAGAGSAAATAAKPARAYACAWGGPGFTTVFSGGADNRLRHATFAAL